MRKPADRKPEPVATDAFHAADRAEATIEARIFLPKGDRSGTESFTATIPDRRTVTSAWIGEIVRALGKSGRTDLAPIFPPSVVIRNAFVSEAGVLYLDLPGSSLKAESGGVQDEILALEALEKTLLANVPGVKFLKILADGADRETFFSHVSIRSPLELR